MMAAMAQAAKEGGAVGIRANGVEDIASIRRQVALPVIGIVKAEYPGSPVYITPTEAEVEALLQAGAETIALDATARRRPQGQSLEEFFLPLRQRYPGQLFMADCATLEEARRAQALGFDLVGTTLCGYTQDTLGTPIPSLPLSLIHILQNKKFVTVSCVNCGYTELYKAQSSDGWNILRCV